MTRNEILAIGCAIVVGLELFAGCAPITPAPAAVKVTKTATDEGATQPSAPAASFESRHRDTLALDYQGFDQTMGAGWRLWGETQGDHATAVQLIESYLATNTALNMAQISTLRFHAAQLLAFSGNDEEAITWFESAHNPSANPNHPVRWNAYVAATVAFMRQDLVALLQARETIAAGPEVTFADTSMIPNLDVVDRLVTHIGRSSYAEAYAPEQ